MQSSGIGSSRPGWNTLQPCLNKQTIQPYNNKTLNQHLCVRPYGKCLTSVLLNSFEQGSSPFTRVAYWIFTLLFTTVAKLELGKSNEIILKLGSHHNTRNCIKGSQLLQTELDTFDALPMSCLHCLLMVSSSILRFIYLVSKTVYTVSLGCWWYMSLIPALGR